MSRREFEQAPTSAELSELVAWEIVKALHEHVPEADRPMSWSDLDESQESRIRAAAVVAIDIVQAADMPMRKLVFEHSKLGDIDRAKLQELIDAHSGRGGYPMNQRDDSKAVKAPEWKANPPEPKGELRQEVLVGTTYMVCQWAESGLSAVYKDGQQEGTDYGSFEVAKQRAECFAATDKELTDEPV